MSFWKPWFEMPGFPHSLAQSRYSVIIDLLQYPGGQLEPLAQRNGHRTQGEASGRSGEMRDRQSFIDFCSAAQGCNLSQRTTWCDSATVWSPPLNVGNCINQHISPKAASIYSTTRLLAVIRPPAKMVFVPWVSSSASQGKGKGMIVTMFVHNPNIWEEQCYDVCA